MSSHSNARGRKRQGSGAQSKETYRVNDVDDAVASLNVGGHDGSVLDLDHAVGADVHGEGGAEEEGLELVTVLEGGGGVEAGHDVVREQEEKVRGGGVGQGGGGL